MQLTWFFTFTLFNILLRKYGCHEKIKFCSNNILILFYVQIQLENLTVILLIFLYSKSLCPHAYMRTPCTTFHVLPTLDFQCTLYLKGELVPMHWLGYPVYSASEIWKSYSFNWSFLVVQKRTIYQICIQHDWYQTETHVIIEVRIKKLDPKDVKVEFHPTALSVSAKLALGKDLVQVFRSKASI